MNILVNDTSCLIDLRKAGFLTAALRLPYRFVVALPLVTTELLDFTEADWGDLKGLGLQVVDLPPNLVAKAFEHRAADPALSPDDCFSLALAEASPKSILLTGDKALRLKAERLNIDVHGVLWVSDQIDEHKTIDVDYLLKGLRLWKDDPLVFLPRAEIDRRIVSLQRRHGR